MSALNLAVVRGVLAWVARGQIVSVDGVLRHRSDVLPAQALSLLQTLHGRGYLTVPPGSFGPPVAVLTVRGTQLLDWSNRQPDPPRWLALVTGQNSDLPADTATEAAVRCPRS